MRRSVGKGFSRVSLLSMILIFAAPLLAAPSGDREISSASDTAFQAIDPYGLYRACIKTALKDGKISEEESAFLRTLERQLRIPPERAIQERQRILDIIPRRLDQSGRWPLVLQNIGWGAGLYGWALPYVLGADDPKWLIGSEMMSFGAAFYFTHKYTEKMDISHARAQMMRAGSALGFHYGYSINDLFGIWDEDDNKAGLTVLMVSVPAGIYAGDRIYGKLLPSHGQSWSLTLWSSLGLFTALQLHNIFDQMPEEPEFDPPWYYPPYQYDPLEAAAYEAEYNKAMDEFDKEEQAWKKRWAVSVMLSYPAGLWAGQHFFGDREYTFGDALMISQGASFGMLYTMLISDLVGLNMNSDAARLMTISGMLGGPILMDRYIRGYDYSFGNAFLMALGSGSGMLFNMGLAAILDVDSEEVIEILLMSGGAAGFYFTSRILDVDREDGNPDITSVDLSLFPTLIYAGETLNYRQSLREQLTPGIALHIRF